MECHGIGRNRALLPGRADLRLAPLCNLATLEYRLLTAVRLQSRADH